MIWYGCLPSLRQSQPESQDNEYARSGETRLDAAEGSSQMVVAERLIDPHLALE